MIKLFTALDISAAMSIESRVTVWTKQAKVVQTVVVVHAVDMI